MDKKQLPNIELIDIKLIKPNPNNPRLIKDDKYQKLVKSIQQFPEMLNLRPIVVNDDLIILGGNMRLKACKEAKMKEVPIIRASQLTEDQQREFIIKDNVGFGEWDWDMIANEWDSEQVQEWGLDLPVFNTNDNSDLSDDIVSAWKIEIELQNESEQSDLYNRLKEEGYSCRILTL